MKVALVCDWLVAVGGAEKVLLKMHQMFPEAPIYTSKYDPKKIDWFKDADVRTGFLQKFPNFLRRFLGPLRQRYFSHLDLSEYDLVISVTGAEAKAVRAPKGIHICYCHVPTQYYWGMYEQYIRNPGFGILNPLVRVVFRLMVGPLRWADVKAARRVDYFVTISSYAQEMIKKYYGREATIIHPPVELEVFRGIGKKVRMEAAEQKRDYYVTSSRQVNWKRIDIAVKAALMSQRKLVVIGEGPEHEKLVKLAKGAELVEFLPLMEREDLAKKLAGARGYLFPSLEPFGIAPVEALAAGCPVIAYGEGGALDYVIEGKNGIFFRPQKAVNLAEGILEFEKHRFNAEKVSRSVDKFSEMRFEKDLNDTIKRCLKREQKNGKKK